MRDMIKYVVSQFFVITVGILFVSGIVNFAAVLNGEELAPYTPHYPLMIIFTGILSSLPTCLLWFREEPTKKQCYLRMLLHFVLVEAIVLAEGWWLLWYKNLAEGMKLAGIVILVFLFVYVYSYFINKDTADSINAALERFREEEVE